MNLWLNKFVLFKMNWWEILLSAGLVFAALVYVRWIRRMDKLNKLNKLTKVRGDSRPIDQVVPTPVESLSSDDPVLGVAMAVMDHVAANEPKLNEFNQFMHRMTTGTVDPANMMTEMQGQMSQLFRQQFGDDRGGAIANSMKEMMEGMLNATGTVETGGPDGSSEAPLSAIDLGSAVPEVIVDPTAMTGLSEGSSVVVSIDDDLLS